MAGRASPRNSVEWPLLLGDAAWLPAKMINALATLVRGHRAVRDADCKSATDVAPADAADCRTMWPEQLHHLQMQRGAFEKCGRFST